MSSAAFILAITGIIALTVCIIYALSIWEGRKSCQHQWEAFEKTRAETPFSVYDRIYLKCTKCGDVKCRKMR